MRIEYVRLSALHVWPSNPKEHDLGAYLESVTRFGFVAPIVIDETTGRIVAGHGALETLTHQRDAGNPPPARVRVDNDGEWLAPVVRDISFPSEEEAEAYLISDNRLTTMVGFIKPRLAEMLQALITSAAGLSGTGFDVDDLDAILKEVEDAVPPPGALAETVTAQTPTLPSVYREVLLDMSVEEHRVFAERLKILRAAWGKTTPEVVMSALELAVSNVG